MKNKISEPVKFLRKHYYDNNERVCRWLTSYIHSSCRYSKQNPDWSWLHVQPAWPEKTVVGYRYYSDPEMAFAHHTNRFMLEFSDNTEYDISVYKFKQFLRNSIL